MQITITVPDDLGARLTDRWQDLRRHALEALAADAYRQGILSSAEVQRILDLPSRFDVARFLEQAGVPLAYDEAELEADRGTWEELRGA
jgi:predicted HTH domain antitoxin